MRPNAPQTPAPGQPSAGIVDLSQRLAASPITTPVQPDQIKPAPDVNLPEPQAFNVQSEYVASASENVARYRQSLDSQFASRRAEIDTEKQRLEKERDKLMKEGVEPNLDPFREDLEKTERKRLKVEENYFANQKLTDELDTLLTQGNQLIEQQRALPVNQAVVNGRVNNTLRDVNARAGVIEAVMAARNNQITQAYTLIDRSVAAITADRNDQLSYYETLLNFNQQDILKLDKEDEKLANEQITLAKSDLERAQATADYIKEKMINPETAQFMAEAGVTLMDSVEDINTKLAAETGRREVEDTKNAYIEQGYEYVAFPTPGQTGLTTVEINGQQLAFKVRPGSPLALDMEAKRANIAQSYASTAAANTRRLIDLAEIGDPNAIAALNLTMPDNTTPTTDEIAYAQQYAATGNIPSGMPKGMSFGRIAELARDIPKPDGSVVDVNTGVKPNVSASTLDSIAALRDVVQKSEQLAQLNEARNKGIVGGIAYLGGSDLQQQYVDLRGEIVDLLARARTGAALTVDEQRYYESQLPDVAAGALKQLAFGPVGGSLGVDTTARIRDNFTGKLKQTLDSKLTTQGLAMYGYSKVQTSQGPLTIGDVITNSAGRRGIVQPDGSITPIQ